ncbi:endopeptidase La [Treponema parvum]|uniref:endopeptidase La n=1 Tax=Treponema parvum TaxID=138851 RepID=UPI0021168849|nr:endopeptidase La [Treponema parvum]
MLPNKLFLIPLQGRPIFPGIFTPLMINSAEDAKIIEESYNSNGFIGIVMLKNDNNTPSITDLYEVGTAARIIKKINLPDGGLNVFISTVKRFKIRKALKSSSPIIAAVDYLNDEEDDTFEVKALTRALISEMKEVSENNPLFSEEMRLNMVNIDHPGKIADFIASILNIDKTEQQKVLELLNVRRRMEQVLVYIKKEQELLRIQKKIQNELNERVEKNQREYFLREELRSIQEELGTDADGNGTDYQKFKDKIAKFNFEGEIKEAVEDELEKFHLMDPNSAEFIGTRNYLELVCALPWQSTNHESYSLNEAKKILEKDHYGLEDVKKRIMEYLSVRKLKKDNKGSILLLVGPPGVGKTSIGHSIAHAMNKPFYRFSVGGMRDEAEIKGHRRTYIGAMPGKILQGMKISKTKAPVFMIDEIDKMGSSFQGDPASALLEVLDPEQNVSFRDNYLDLPFDISDVFFILTANTLDTVPAPLLDRAEIIQLPGYIDQEKIEIAKKYLIPKNLAKNGLSKNQVVYTKNALVTIAEEYAREAGVRNFEKCLDKIDRKIVTELLNAAEEKAEKARKEAQAQAKASGKNKNGKVKSQSEKARTDAAGAIDANVASAGVADSAGTAGVDTAGANAADAENFTADASDATAINSTAASTGAMAADSAEAADEKDASGKTENAATGTAAREPVAKDALGHNSDAPVNEIPDALSFIDKEKTYTIDSADLNKYLGKPVFDESEVKKAVVPGTAIGLAWTSMGGDTLLIESIAFPGKGSVELTGQMGDVMKESAEIALNWVKRSILEQKIKESDWFEKNVIHLHIPEGATPKDGPSAGITMATTFMSLLTGRVIKSNLAMTGELSLTGQVLPIGGLREKTVAARRNGIKTIIIPKGNVRDLDEIPVHVKSGIKFLPVTRVEEVMDLVFPPEKSRAKKADGK